MNAIVIMAKALGERLTKRSQELFAQGAEKFIQTFSGDGKRTIIH